MLGDIRQGRGFFARLLIALALIAAGLQSGIPRGYMLDRDDETGRFSVVFCTGQGPVTRWVDPATGAVGEHEEAPAAAGNGQACVFAMASAAGPLPALDTWVPPVRIHTQDRPRTQAARTVAAQGLQPPVRAPPATL